MIPSRSATLCGDSPTSRQQLMSVRASIGKHHVNVKFSQLFARQPAWGGPGQRTTATGEWLWAATSEVVEPSSSSENPPCPREPSTTRSASRDSSMSANPGVPRTGSVTSSTPSGGRPGGGQHVVDLGLGGGVHLVRSRRRSRRARRSPATAGTRRARPAPARPLADRAGQSNGSHRRVLCRGCSGSRSWSSTPTTTDRGGAHLGVLVDDVAAHHHDRPRRCGAARSWRSIRASSRPGCCRCGRRRSSPPPAASASSTSDRPAWPCRTTGTMRVSSKLADLLVQAFEAFCSISRRDRPPAPCRSRRRPASARRARARSGRRWPGDRCAHSIAALRLRAPVGTDDQRPRAVRPCAQARRRQMPIASRRQSARRPAVVDDVGDPLGELGQLGVGLLLREPAVVDRQTRDATGPRRRGQSITVCTSTPCSVAISAIVLPERELGAQRVDIDAEQAGEHLAVEAGMTAMPPGRPGPPRSGTVGGEMLGDGVGLGGGDRAVVDEILEQRSGSWSPASASRSVSRPAVGVRRRSSVPASSVDDDLGGRRRRRVASRRCVSDGIATRRPIAPPPSRPAVTPIAVVRRLRRRSGVVGVLECLESVGGFMDRSFRGGVITGRVRSR